jgi:2-(1,2-epoxy-1,2-dihydrophenyl)acetyl-CoA isomerase
VKDGVGRIHLARPDAANSIDLEFAKEYRAAAAAVRAGGARAVLIDADGKLFCGGGDVKAFGGEEHLGDHLDEITLHLHAGIADLVEGDAPVVAAVQGPAAGAGVGLVCSADIVLASPRANFTMAYTAIGLSPDGSSSWFLPRLVGLRRATELTLTNRRLSAEEALEWGIVTRIVDEADLQAEASTLVGELAHGPTLAFGRSKRLLREALDDDLRSHLAAESKALAASGDSADGREGVAAFLAKRPASFEAR